MSVHPPTDLQRARSRRLTDRVGSGTVYSMNTATRPEVSENAATHPATIGGCVRESLVYEASAAGCKYRNAVRRGDFRSPRHAWDTADHGVGYPYMTGAEYIAARAAFEKAAR